MNVEQFMYDYTASSEWKQVARLKWHTNEVMDFAEAFAKQANPVENRVSQPSEPTFGQWIDIEERLPKEDGEYLVKLFHISMTPKSSIRILYGAPYTLEKFGNIYNNFGWQGTHSELKVTHWMPLPKP